MKPLKIARFGDCGILLTWKEEISLQAHRAIMQTDEFIKSHFESAVLETTPSYCSLAIYLNSEVNPEVIINELNQMTWSLPQTTQRATHKITLPVCYETPYACDIEAVAAYHNLTINEVVALHTAPNYHVYFIGFLPGFPYLGGLSKQLYTPRKETPKAQIESGAVGIGGMQTGIYPNVSPGGWHIIGQTPIPLFDVSKNPPALLSAGDIVRFKAIDLVTFHKIKEELAQGKYQIEREVYHA